MTRSSITDLQLFVLSLTLTLGSFTVYGCICSCEGEDLSTERLPLGAFVVTDAEGPDFDAQAPSSIAFDNEHLAIDYVVADTGESATLTYQVTDLRVR